MIRTIGNKRKYGKKTAILFFAVLWFFQNIIYGFASGEKFFLQSYRTDEGKAVIYGAALPNAGSGAETGKFTADISGQEVPVLEVSTTEKNGEGITLYCLVDISGSMKEEQLVQAKEVLLAISEGLAEGDNMVVGSIGTEIERTDFLSDKNEIDNVVDGLVADEEYTALYDAVIESISVMSNSKKCHQKKCLVIISDGDDETVIGRTRNEVLKAISDSKIPIYTVAALRSSYTQQQIECAENLGALARQSSGGKDYVPVITGLGSKETGLDILQDNRDGVVLTLDISEAKPPRDEALLRIQFETDDASYSDTLDIYAADLGMAAKPEEETEGIQIDNDGEAEEKKEVSLPGYVWLFVALAVSFIVVAVVLIIVRKQKAEKKENDSQISDSGLVTEKRTVMKEGLREQDLSNQGKETAGRTCSTDKLASRYEVKFIAVGYESKEVRLFLPEGKILTLGRNQKANLVLDAKDTHLSSIHCKIRCMQNIINIWDMDSQNGTFVNGVPVKKLGMAIVNNEDIVRMGSYEYRVYITKK